MRPIIDLNKTAITQINEVNLELVQVVLHKHKPINFFATVSSQIFTLANQ